MSEFKTPAFLENCSVDDFYEIIRDELPEDIDSSEGGHVWNFTRPAAIVAARMCEFILPEAIKVSIPEFSYGEYLDNHAKGRSITRKSATAATGELVITGAPKTFIPAGSLFATSAIDENPSIDYVTLEDAYISDEGTVTVDIQCKQTGVVGNTPANTIILVGSKISGITAVTNPEPVTGGTEEETDESLQSRISDYDRTQGESYTGSVADYKRWATSVPGVGDATVIPANDDTGLVTLIITDANGTPATEDLCEAVYNYIMKPDDEGARLAPINAYLSVIPPSTMPISVLATVELEADTTIDDVKAAFLAQLALYLPQALDEGEVKCTRVARALSKTAGVNDYSGLQIGVKGEEYGTKNIPVTDLQLPTVEAADLILTEGTVE